ncbi:nucleosome-remodeling factor subunit BPTF [Lingula anatina]|uniref:Nucleosome-remodeling factor subunit BPTF n=1 Tax=Lingula anatina TaxID=7574 RepID=A0A1S3JB92_LINAN|nr:nucleosome-remodeling factor subunit BPTF [Lingula anatina]|eukprot:XP_013407675.1 nucleosome-remodeling factor subunit BPTF [Lingula anatina]
MSSRGKRGRGRPPRNPLSGKSHFLKTPKRQAQIVDRSSRASTPASSISGRGGRERDARTKSRSFIRAALDEDDFDSRDSFNDSEADLSDHSDLDSEIPLALEDDSEFELDESVCSDEELETTQTKPRVYRPRPKSPEFVEDETVIPPLILPTSSTDLMMPSEHLMKTLSIYEVLHRFRVILRLTPFTLEDFIAALVSDEQCCLLAEIHIALLRSLLREEDGNNTTFGPHDVKDSINIQLFFLDGMTWPELIRAYLDSDLHQEYRAVMPALEKPGYPFVGVADKLQVLTALTDLYLGSNAVREDLMNEGNVAYDDHCRACHKLGDLLCCETCSAVYHLGCVDPPLEEVPDDDWVCTVCQGNQVKGVTDCISELEKSALPSRHDPIGYDRHRRKYWFMCRRLIVEDDNEVWYYSSTQALAELLECLDHSYWERHLVNAIMELDDIKRQIQITDELTNAHKGSRKSALEEETTNLIKLQTERAAKKAREEEERKRLEEEKKLEAERKRIEEEERRLRGEETGVQLGPGWSVSQDSTVSGISTEGLTKPDGTPVGETRAPGEMQQSTNTEEVLQEQHTLTTGTSTEIATSTTNTRSVNEDGVEEKIMEVEVTTTTTTVTTATTTVKMTTIETGAGDASAEQEKTDVEKKEPPSSNTSPNESASASGDSEMKTQGEDTEAVKPKVVSLQSTFPNAKATVLDTGGQTQGNDTNQSPKAQSNTKIVMIGKDGKQMTITLQGPPPKNLPPGTTVVNSTSSVVKGAVTNTEEASAESRKMVTRSRTGSLTPKQFTDSITSTTASVKMTSVRSLQQSNEDSVLVINKDGQISKVGKSQSSVVQQQNVLFKLGMEGNYKMYVNQYTTNDLALNKHQHAEERDKKRWLSHKFSLTPVSEFKWNGTIYGNRTLIVSTLRLSITQLEQNIPSAFLHPNWPYHRQSWVKAVHMCQSAQDFSLALAIFEACIKPVVFLPVWSEALGHVRMQRITAADKEELKKREKELRKQKKDEDEDWNDRSTWVKYTLGLKHQVWKQKGEEYRIYGGSGWLWLSAARTYHYVPQGTVGLRGVVNKLRRRWKEKCAEEQSTDFAKSDLASDAPEVKEGEGQGEEKMDVDEQSEEKEKKDEAPKGEKSMNEEVKEEEKKMEVDNDGEKESNEDQKVEKTNAEKESEPKTDKKKAEVKSKSSPGKSKLEQAKFDEEARLKAEAEGMRTDLIDVSKSLLERTFYPKLTKPAAKLDIFLERRVKQDEWEKKQRRALEHLITKHNEVEKQKLAAKEAGKKGSLKNENEDKIYQCYSSVCRKEKGSNTPCFSITCQMSTNIKKEPTDVEMKDVKSEPTEQKVGTKDEKPVVLNGEIGSDGSDSKISSSDRKTEKGEDEDEDVDVEAVKEEGMEEANKDADSKTSGFMNSFLSFVQKDSTKGEKPEGKEQEKDTESAKQDQASTSGEGNLKSETKVAVKSSPQSGVTLTGLANTLSSEKLKEIASKMPKVRGTNEKVYLPKFIRLHGKKAKNTKKLNLPGCQKFSTKSGKRSVFILENHDLKRLSRKAGMVEAKGFNYNCKMNNVNWIYPCPRPLFKTAWRYRTQTAVSLASACVQLRVIWACIRWDDMSVKPPQGGTNTVTTDSEIITTELLKRRDIGHSGLQSEFLVRKIIVPIGLPSQPKEKYTPQRKGLRERRRAESPKITEPCVNETWTPEEQLELWEIKQFGEKVERQKQVIQQKLVQVTTQQAQQQQLTQTPIKPNNDAAHIRAQLEKQLKEQRTAFQQKKLEEQARSKTGSVSVSAAPSSIISALGGSSTTAAGAPAFKTIVVKPPGGATTVTTPSSQQRLILTQKGGEAVGSIPPLSGQRVGRVATLQLPGTTITVRPKNTLTISRPATGTTATQSTPTRLIAPAGQITTAATPGTKAPVVATGVPGQPQQVQIIQGPQGVLTVRGLLPGQQIIRLPDGRLQLITVSTAGGTPQASQQQQQQQQTPSSAASSTTQVLQLATPATPATPVRTQLQLRPIQPAASAVTLTPPRLVVAPRMVTTVSPAGQRLIRPAQLIGQAATPTAVAPAVSIATTTQVQPAAAVVQSNPPQSVIPSVVSSSPSASPMSSPLSSPTTSPLKAQMLLKMPALASAVTQQQQQQQQQAAANKQYAITPQVLQQVVQQAMLQNQDPDIQAKLMAMQRQITVQNQQKQQISTLQARDKLIQSQAQQAQQQQKLQQAQAVEQLKAKQQKPVLTPEQKEEQNRVATCKQVMKTMLDKLEKEERASQKQAKKQETAEEKQKRVTATKLQGLLYKQKEALKKDMLKKRDAMEKLYVAEVQADIAEQYKVLKNKGSPRKRKSSEEVDHVIVDVTTVEEATKVKKKKQKVISTGTPRSQAQQEKLYCICRTPYDDTKFYIGCDLCSNWFHGDCVNISEYQAKLIDTYVCEDCKAQQENTSEELYCICRTPYDETQLYIGCDRCQDWFHGSCVGISKSEADMLSTYICPNCQQKSTDLAAHQHLLQPQDFDSLIKLLRSLQSHKMAWPFLEPVDPDEVPDYYDVIKEPMDLSTVEKKLKSKAYRILGEFVRDVTKIFDNCRYYNPHDSPFYQCAEVLETFFVQKLNEIKAKT